MAEEGKRNFPYLIAWGLFFATMAVGAGLFLSPKPALQIAGFALLFAPVLLFGALMGLFYWRSRRIASDE